MFNFTSFICHPHYPPFSPVPKVVENQGKTVFNKITYCERSHSVNDILYHCYFSLGKYIIIDVLDEDDDYGPVKDMEADPMDEIRRRRLATEKLMAVRNAHCELMLLRKNMTIDKQETKSVRLLQHSASQVRYEFKVMQVNIQKSEIEKRRLQDPDGDFTYEDANIQKSEQMLKGGVNEAFYMQKNNPSQTRSMKNPNIVSPALAEARKILRQKVTERELEIYRQKQESLRNKRPHTTGDRDLKFSHDVSRSEVKPKTFKSDISSKSESKLISLDNAQLVRSEPILSQKSLNTSAKSQSPRNKTPQKSVRIQTSSAQQNSDLNNNIHHDKPLTNGISASFGNDYNESKEAFMTSNGNQSELKDSIESTNKKPPSPDTVNEKVTTLVPNIKILHVSESIPTNNVAREQSSLTQRSSLSPLNTQRSKQQLITNAKDMVLYNKMLQSKEGKSYTDKGSEAITKLIEMGIIPHRREKSCPDLKSARNSSKTHRSTPSISRSQSNMSTVKRSQSVRQSVTPISPRRPRTQELIHNEQVSIQQKLHKFYHDIEEDKQRWIREQEEKHEEEEAKQTVENGLEQLLSKAVQESKMERLFLGLPAISKNLPPDEYKRRRSQQIRKKWSEVGQKVMDNLDMNQDIEEIHTTGHVYSVTAPNNQIGKNDASIGVNKGQKAAGTVFAPDGTVIQRFSGFGHSQSKKGGAPMHSINRSKRKTATFKLRKLVEDIMVNKTRYELQEYVDVKKKLNTSHHDST